MATDHDKNSDDLYGISAGRDYDDDVRRFIRDGRVEPAAATARRSVDGPDGEGLHEAELEAARKGAMPGDPPWLAKVRAAAHHAIDVALSSVGRAEEWLAAKSPKAGYTSDARSPDDHK